MMMAATLVDLQVVFYEMTFHSSACKLGSNGGFYIFARVFGAVAHGSRQDYIGKNVTEILALAGDTAVNGTAVHEDFSAAALNGGGWVR